MEKPKIGISVGDINGIGLEVIIKTISDPRILNLCTPVVYGSAKVLSYHKNITELEFPFHQVRNGEKFQLNAVNVVNCWQESVNINLGQITEEGGVYAIKSLAGAVKELKDGQIDGLVTAPINKETMELAKFGFPGHTEYLTHAFGQSESLMFMVQDNLRVGLVTNHLPLNKVASAITKNQIIKKIHLMETSLQQDFGIDKPTIAVLG
jgi:4-hydroxythreonine-4-phosphate dehydrogenase